MEGFHVCPDCGWCGDFSECQECGKDVTRYMWDRNEGCRKTSWLFEELPDLLFDNWFWFDHGRKIMIFVSVVVLATVGWILSMILN
jgi:hypothetical protein